MNLLGLRMAEQKSTQKRAAFERGKKHSESSLDLNSLFSELVKKYMRAARWLSASVQILPSFLLPSLLRRTASSTTDTTYSQSHQQIYSSQESADLLLWHPPLSFHSSPLYQENRLKLLVKNFPRKKIWKSLQIRLGKLSVSQFSCQCQGQGGRKRDSLFRINFQIGYFRHNSFSPHSQPFCYVTVQWLPVAFRK